MTAYATIQYLRDTDSWKNYTPEWRAHLIQKTPDIEWKYWLKGNPPIYFRDLPIYFDGYFCFNELHDRKYWPHSNTWGIMSCGECGGLSPKLWPLVVFECDECEEPFVGKYPVRYHLCPDCGG